MRNIGNSHLGKMHNDLGAAGGLAGFTGSGIFDQDLDAPTVPVARHARAGAGSKDRATMVLAGRERRLETPRRVFRQGEGHVA